MTDGSPLPDRDDVESADAETPQAFDLTPRTPAAPSSGAGGRRTWFAVGGVALVVVALGLVLFNGLRDASTFFYNADEAVAKQSSLGTKRFRMQGNVVPGSVRTTADGIDFVLKYGTASVAVHHVGDPPELFGPEIPVVLEGAFRSDGRVYESDQILIRHDSTYDEKNADRVRAATRDAEQRANG
ncbi:MAG: cytochrome c maturation protein CcmE [Actinomycetes bacterium]